MNQTDQKIQLLSENILISGIAYLVSNEYQYLKQYIKSLKQEYKEYKLRLEELKEDGLEE